MFHLVQLINYNYAFVTISDIYFELTILFHDFFHLSFRMLGDVRIFKFIFSLICQYVYFTVSKVYQVFSFVHTLVQQPLESLHLIPCLHLC